MNKEGQVNSGLSTLVAAVELQVLPEPLSLEATPAVDGVPPMLEYPAAPGLNQQPPLLGETHLPKPKLVQDCDQLLIDTQKITSISTLEPDLMESMTKIPSADMLHSQLADGFPIVLGCIKERFLNICEVLQPFLEFLTQSTSNVHLLSSKPNAHMISNCYVTSLPLVYFSNILYSKELLVSIAARTFAVSSKPAARSLDASNIWGYPLPIMDNADSYQFWVVHLNGCTGEQYLNGVPTSHHSRLYKTHDSLVAFVRNQFDELRLDEEAHLRGGFTNNCETIYIAGFNSSQQVSPHGKQLKPQRLTSIAFSSCIFSG
jgi:hypothetical protein